MTSRVDVMTVICSLMDVMDVICRLMDVMDAICRLMDVMDAICRLTPKRQGEDKRAEKDHTFDLVSPLYDLDEWSHDLEPSHRFGQFLLVLVERFLSKDIVKGRSKHAPLSIRHPHIVPHLIKKKKKMMMKKMKK
jgi:hypothetical protein